MHKYIFRMAALILTTLMVSAVSAQSELETGEKIYSPGYLTSANGVYKLSVQTDGNLVLHKNNNPIWATGTSGVGDAVLSMQGDGNLVLYKLPNWQPVWHSNTWNIGYGARLSVQDDGNTVLYDAAGSAKWSTGTWQAPEISYTALQNPPQDRQIILRSESKCIMFSKTVFGAGTSQTLASVLGVDKGECVNFKVQLKGGTNNQYYLTTPKTYDERNTGYPFIEGENYRYISNGGSDKNNKNMSFKRATGFNGTSKFIWRFIDKGNGFYQIVSINSGMCLDVGSNGRLKQHYCHGGSNQQFSFENFNFIE